MFESLGRSIARRPRLTVAAWALIAAAAVVLAMTGAGGASLFDRLSAGAPVVPGSDSQRGADLLAAESPDGPSLSLVLLGVPTDTTGLPTAMQTVHRDLGAIDGVASVVDPFVLPGGPENPAAAPLIAADGDGFLVLVTLAPDLTDAQEDAALAAVETRLLQVPEDLGALAPGATGVVGGLSLIYAEIVTQMERDLVTGEIVALPLALIIMVLVFGGFMAASMPLAGALASIATGLGVLLCFSYLMDMDPSVVNIITVLGLGLSIDYSLLVVSRFREELLRMLAVDDGARVRRRRGDGAVQQALAATMRTAGRTVAFSALTIAIATSGLLVFSPPILKSFGLAGIAIILVALATAITLVPALLLLFGRRLARPGVLARVPGMRRVLSATSDVQREEGWISSLTRRVQRRPLVVLVAVVAGLVVLAAPLTHIDLRNTTLQLLPESSPQRVYVEHLGEQYPATQAATVFVVAESTLSETAAWAGQLDAIDGVERVDQPQPLGGVVVIGVHTDSDDVGGPAEREVVLEIRGLEAEFPVYVTGDAAHQIDFVDALREGAPQAAALVVLAILVLLFLMTGSVVIPVKALLTNALSIAASLGVLVWAFQDGHLSGLLDFQPVGGIETYVLALVVAFAFGLAMDYEVFLLARIKEAYDGGADPHTAIRAGVQRSGRIITSAAAIMIVVFVGFVFGKLLVIKEVGFALAVAVFIDATFVRLLLVPATLTLLGKWAWWAPASLRRVHERLAITH